LGVLNGAGSSYPELASPGYDSLDGASDWWEARDPTLDSTCAIDGRRGVRDGLLSTERLGELAFGGLSVPVGDSRMTSGVVVTELLLWGETLDIALALRLALGGNIPGKYSPLGDEWLRTASAYDSG
jgi:hypothetical protein